MARRPGIRQGHEYLGLSERPLLTKWRTNILRFIYKAGYSTGPVLRASCSHQRSLSSTGLLASHSARSPSAEAFSRTEEMRFPWWRGFPQCGPGRSRHSFMHKHIVSPSTHSIVFILLEVPIIPQCKLAVCEGQVPSATGSSLNHSPKAWTP